MSAARDSLHIVVLGSIVRLPLGGLAWHHLQFVLGLARLGHEVCFLEDSNDYDWSCYDPIRQVTDRDPTYGLKFAGELFGRVGLGDHWVYYDAHTSRWLGPCADRAMALCGDADLLLNLGNSNPLRPWTEQIPIRVLVDTDPVFTQLYHLTDPARRARALKHTAFFSFAGNIGREGCTVPSDELPWQPIRQPIVLDVWPVTEGPSGGSFTTVMQWDSYPTREFGGVRYGMKSDSFGPYLDLPQRTGQRLELAIGSTTAPRDRLRAIGWHLINPLEPTRDPWTYQRYLQQSKAEFTVAKHGYVISRSGWFSERSAAYLASGRPVLTEDTGFSDWLPIGNGLLAFSTPEEALAGIDAINSRYASHCRAARAVAEEHFDARKVLSALLERALCSVADP
jgi:hypothetical protein